MKDKKQIDLFETPQNFLNVCFTDSEVKELDDMDSSYILLNVFRMFKNNELSINKCKKIFGFNELDKDFKERDIEVFILGG